MKIWNFAKLSPVLLLVTSCSNEQPTANTSAQSSPAPQAMESHVKASVNSAEQSVKPVIYQVFTRLFGNTNTTNKPWGTAEENGVGKFSDFSNEALQGIKSLGTTHVWYTGVPHHAVVADYTEFGIGNDDPDVIKGRAGSPYAVKDYYNVNPDLADDPSQRLQEFEALIKRTHDNGMKVIIDIVPNHVARHYESQSAPAGVSDFGANDDIEVAYSRDNNFYYVKGESFQVPVFAPSQLPLGGEVHPQADGKFAEFPAKWTGNGSRASQPDVNDWYETVKVNYGVRPDGSYDFPTLPEEYRQLDYTAHAAFWADKSLPDSWYKFRDIAVYWLNKGVDGFRYDMAEMVPVEFWSFLNSTIKMQDPDSFLLAEVYQPHLYRDYIQLGKMDALYDKVEFYDSLKLVMQGKGGMSAIEQVQEGMQDIESHMLHFLENHDEQRIASPDFAGDAEKGRPALVVSALISRSPTMVYFGQDVGEDGSEDAGFGKPTRTSIFDYVGVPAHQRWMNDGKFDGGGLSAEEKALRQYYQQVLNLSAQQPAFGGEYASLHSTNLKQDNGYSEQQFAFMRWSNEQQLLVASNFGEQEVTVTLTIPQEIAEQTWLAAPESATDILEGNPVTFNSRVQPMTVTVTLPALGSSVIEFK